MNNSKKVSSNVVSGSMGVTWAAWSEDWSRLISIPKPIETVIEKLLTHLENEKKTFELLLVFFLIHLSCWQVSATDARIWGIWTPDQLDYGVAMCQKIPLVRTVCLITFLVGTTTKGHGFGVFATWRDLVKSKQSCGMIKTNLVHFNELACQEQ